MKPIFSSASSRVPLVVLLVLGCQTEPKASADATFNVWQNPLEDELGFIFSTDGLTPEEENAIGRRESCEAFKDTGHALDGAI